MHNSLKSSLILSTPSPKQPRRRNPQQCGKIVKNSLRTKTETSTIITAVPDKENYCYGTIRHMKMSVGGGFDRSRRWDRDRDREDGWGRSKVLRSYQSKLANYENNKRSILKDIDRLNTQQPETKSSLTSSHFLIQKLKQSLKPPSIQSQLNQTLPQSSQSNKSPTSQKFLKQLQIQIRLQTKLRHLKLQITPTNRKQITQLITKFYSSYQYDLETIMNICYEEYQVIKEGKEGKDGREGRDGREGEVSAEVLGQRIVEMYQICQSNWKENLEGKFYEAEVKGIFQNLNLSSKGQIDLKSFTRELNLYFCRNYQPREFYRIYNRISPLTKSNFIKTFSSPQ